MALDYPIYVVDDDDAVREALTALLEAARFTVEAFGSAEAFLAAVPGRRPAPGGCLVLDLDLPGLSGLELLAVIDEKQIEIAVIAMTGRPTKARRDRAIAAGAVDLLGKPVLERPLLAAIRRASRGNRRTR